MPESNRWKLTSMRDGFADSLVEAKDKLTALLADTKSTSEQRAEQQKIVADLTDRLERVNAEIEAFDKAAEAADKARHASVLANPELPEEARITKGYADLIRAVMAKKPITSEIRAALKDDTSTGGGNFLPKTVSSQIITEPFVKNPLRDHSTYTGIENLEIPRLDFSISDDDFIADGEIAKEMEAKGSTVVFGRHKFKVFSEVSETILRGSDIDLTSYVNRGLTSGLAAKEKKVAFATSPKSGEEHMSFYAETVGIKKIECNTLLSGIRTAVADLDDYFADRALICMRKADYFAIIEALANGNATLYSAQPESILGVPVFFCSNAVKPIVGDFDYSHFNYAPGITYESDKDIKTGMNVFAITAWFDHHIKLASAFRIVDLKSD